jgi:hypothetical protein
VTVDLSEEEENDLSELLSWMYTDQCYMHLEYTDVAAKAFDNKVAQDGVNFMFSIYLLADRFAVEKLKQLIVSHIAS